MSGTHIENAIETLNAKSVSPRNPRIGLRLPKNE